MRRDEGNALAYMSRTLQLNERIDCTVERSHLLRTLSTDAQRGGDDVRAKELAVELAELEAQLIEDTDALVDLRSEPGSRPSPTQGRYTRVQQPDEHLRAVSFGDRRAGRRALGVTLCSFYTVLSRGIPIMPRPDARHGQGGAKGDQHLYSLSPAERASLSHKTSRFQEGQ